MSHQLIEQVRSQGNPSAADRPHTVRIREDSYTTWGKRALDVLCSLVGLVALSPVFGIVACWIKLTSPGSLFYRQMRVGKDGGQFQILKFRSMLDRASPGLGITISGDTRVTPVGVVLRRYKLDELPQLWNVLRGDMSLVGPRPELPNYVATYTEEQRQVLTVRPGITDPASLAYRYEERILAEHPTPEQFYRTHILPDKLARNLSYIQSISLKSDLRIIIQTIESSLASSRKN